MAIDRANALCGAIFIAFGAYFALNALSLDLGTAFRMGPGFFPLALAAVLILLGVVIFVQALRVHGEAVGPIAWRGMLLILPAPIFFGLTIRGLGFVPALFVTAFIACFASMRMSLLWALLLSAAVTGFSTLVFIEGLGLPFMLFGPWLRG
jgi:hypothetical protein